MKSKFLKLFLIFVFLLLASALIKSKASEAPFIKAIYSVPNTFDPIKMNDTSSLMVSNLIYEGLLKLSPSLTFTSSLASSWTIDKTGKTYVFKLRQNAFFHDGSQVTPDDVVTSLRRAQSKASLVSKYYDCIDEIKSVGPNQVSIKLKYPFPPFLSILAGATAKILPKDKINLPGFFSHPIGSGPFKFIELKKINENESIIKLSHFNKSNSTTNIKNLILRSMPEILATEEAQKGKIHDLTTFPLSGVESIFKNGQDIPTIVSATWIIGMNSKLPPFDNIKVRKAFKASVNIEEFRLKFHADSEKATGYIPVGFPGHLMKKDLPLTEKKIIIPTHVPIKIAFPSVLAKEKEMRELLQTNLRKRGWNITFVPMEWGKLMEGYNQKSLQGFVLSMNMDYPDTEFLIRNFESNNPDNFSGLKDKLVDSLINKARHTEDRLERAKIYTKISKKIEDLALTVNLFYPRVHYWVNDCVKNFKPNILAEYYIDYSEVMIDQSCLNKLGR